MGTDRADRTREADPRTEGATSGEEKDLDKLGVSYSRVTESVDN